MERSYVNLNITFLFHKKILSFLNYVFFVILCLMYGLGFNPLSKYFQWWKIPILIKFRYVVCTCLVMSNPSFRHRGVMENFWGQNPQNFCTYTSFLLITQKWRILLKMLLYVMRSSTRYTKLENKISQERRLKRMRSKWSKSCFCKKLLEKTSGNTILKYYREIMLGNGK